MAFFTTLSNFYHSDRRLLRYQFQKFADFLYIVWQNGLEERSCPRRKKSGEATPRSAHESFDATPGTWTVDLDFL